MSIKAHFKHLLEGYVHRFKAIENALAFIEILSIDKDFSVGFATGGWKETAELKCNAVGLNLHNHMLKSSNDHYNRGKIIELVIQEAKMKHAIQTFESITYFGDGLWDFKTTQNLKIDFIGVDSHGNNRLKNAGVEKVIKDFVPIEKILNWLNAEE